ncbi:MAG: hypothetical protein AAF193_11075 [Bacteroidota bacterium]
MEVIAAAAANLPNGDLMVWSSYSKQDHSQFSGTTWTSLVDPQTMIQKDHFVQANHDMFCPGTAILPDMRVMVSGGSNANAVTFYDPNSNEWVRGADMVIPRGYQSMTMLEDGRVFTVGGSWPDGRPGFGNKTGEVWDPRTNLWEKKSGILAEKMLTNDKDGGKTSCSPER